MRKRTVFILAITGMAFATATAFAESARSLVEEGNVAYASGKYDRALEAYEKAAVEMPESAHIYFDKGAAYYKKEDFEKAAQAFEQAALKSKTADLEAKSRFNLGLCSFREAERQKDSDPGKALEACETSIRHFQDTLKLKPDFKEAAENIEVVRLTMKSILDAIEKQKEEARKQQEAMQKTADEIRRLIDEQQALLDRNTDLSAQKDQNGDSQELQSEMSDLAEEQNSLSRQTSDAAENVPAPAASGQQPNQAAANPVKDHLENAASEQGKASEKLEGNQPEPAQENQKKALDELQNALAALEKGNEAQQNQAENQGDKEKGQQAQSAENKGQKDQDEQKEAQAADKNEGQSDRPKEEGKQQEDEQQAQMAQLPDNPQQILDEERKNRNERDLGRAGGFSEVDKDW